MLSIYHHDLLYLSAASMLFRNSRLAFLDEKLDCTAQRNCEIHCAATLHRGQDQLLAKFK
jgi:hypothetical protein